MFTTMCTRYAREVSHWEWKRETQRSIAWALFSSVRKYILISQDISLVFVSDFSGWQKPPNGNRPTTERSQPTKLSWAGWREGFDSKGFRTSNLDQVDRHRRQQESSKQARVAACNRQVTTDVHNTCQMTFCKNLDNYIIEIYGKMWFNPCRIKSRWLIWIKFNPGSKLLTSLALVTNIVQTRSWHSKLMLQVTTATKIK